MSPTDPNQVENPSQMRRMGTEKHGSKGATKTWVIETTEFLSKAAVEVFLIKGNAVKIRIEHCTVLVKCEYFTKQPVNQNRTQIMTSPHK